MRSLADHPSGPRGPRQLALMLSAAYLVTAGALGAILLTTSGTTSSAEPVPVPATDSTAPRTSATARTTETVSSTDTATVTTTPADAVLPGFQRIATKAGMTTVIPDGWQALPCESGNGCEQSTDPVNSGRFLRFGGSPSSATDLLTVQTGYERDFAKRPGYQRLRFEPGSYHGFPSVEWEFEWISVGVGRHVRVLYWRAAGYDNLVYASSTSDTWAQALPLYQAMIDNSTP